jgi:hypothetical protein
VNENLEKIILLIEEETRGFYRNTPSNSGDTYLGTRIRQGFQLIFGVCNSDPMGSGVEFYERNTNYELKGTNFSPSFLPFPYTDKEILIKVLEGLSYNYKADLNINRLIRDINFNDDRPIFIVVTIVAYPVILPITS